MEELKRAPRYKKIGERLIRTLPEFEYIKNSGVRIAYLSSDEEKKKNRKIILADCNKVSNRYSWCCKYDFFIVVYEMNTLLLTPKQIEILIQHELHHIGIDEEANGNEYYIVPHDIEEFWDVIDAHGLEWQGGENAEWRKSEEQGEP